ncbi:MAG: hypothetical protein RLN88_11260 [Ekhidna sp.]|uniref:hypothetical protein n=1 Tax=Ekhidna sp. TaxID=2608089 RepID=UPI0032EC34AE
MFTEYEIESMLEYPEVKEATITLKRDFLKTEAPYLEISDDDFFSLIIMAPTIGIAMADGKITLFEEMALNKKARKLSKGGYFMKKDPVIYAMKFLIKNYYNWSDKFMDVLKKTIKVTCGLDTLVQAPVEKKGEVNYQEYRQAVLHSPYLLIRFIASFFLENDEDIINQNHKVGKEEYQRMLLIGEKLELDRVPVFQMFCKTFQ